MGNTGAQGEGSNDNIHLHFEVWRQGERRAPDGQADVNYSGLVDPSRLIDLPNRYIRNKVCSTCSEGRWIEQDELE